MVVDMPEPRRRLSPDDRRHQLLDMALRFSLKPIWVADDLYFLAAAPADG